MDSFAENALGADVHVDGSEAEIVARVIGSRICKIQVTCDLRNKPPARFWLDEVGKLVDKPAVRQS